MDKVATAFPLIVDKLRRLQAKLDKGSQSLDRGEGRELDLKDIIKRARAQHGRA